MTETEIAQAAAERWGDTDPTFDAVISEHTPMYGTEPAPTERWHRIARMAYNLVVTPGRCEHCDMVLHGKTSGSRRYCDHKCASEAYRERTEAGQSEARSLTDRIG